MMKNIHLRFILTGIVFAVYGLWFSGDGVSDLKLHGTYVVIEQVMVYLFFGGYLAYCGILYFILARSGKREIKGGHTHYLLTVLPVVGWILSARGFMGRPDWEGWWMMFLLFLELGSQVLLPVNIIRAIFFGRLQTNGH